jgi:aspartyl-tRNA(Asn)/glutamyl-tRNA(Gln) amidotransferase subunit B
LSEKAAATLTSHPDVATFYEAALKLHASPKKVANWIQTEVMRGANTHGQNARFPVSPEQVAALVKLVDAGEISGKQAKQVYAEIEGTDQSPDEVVQKRGMKVQSDEGELLEMCQQVIEANPKGVETYRSGKKGTLGFFVGQVMKLSKGSANPKLVSQLLQKLLDGDGQ